MQDQGAEAEVLQSHMTASITGLSPAPLLSYYKVGGAGGEVGGNSRADILSNKWASTSTFNLYVTSFKTHLKTFL